MQRHYAKTDLTRPLLKIFTEALNNTTESIVL